MSKHEHIFSDGEFCDTCGNTETTCELQDAHHRIALLEKVAVHAQFYLNGLPDADGYELGEALRAAGYLEERK